MGFWGLCELGLLYGGSRPELHLPAVPTGHGTPMVRSEQGYKWLLEGFPRGGSHHSFEILASEDLEGMEAFVSLNACSEDRLTEGEAGSFLLYGKTLHTLIFDHKIERGHALRHAQDLVWTLWWPRLSLWRTFCLDGLRGSWDLVSGIPRLASGSRLPNTWMNLAVLAPLAWMWTFRLLEASVFETCSRRLSLWGQHALFRVVHTVCHTVLLDIVTLLGICYMGVLWKTQCFVCGRLSLRTMWRLAKCWITTISLLP